MATKKPTAKQLAARKLFAERAKNGTLSKKRGIGKKRKNNSLGRVNTPAKKTTTTKRKKSVSARTLCRKVIKVPGINSRTGQLLKGWRYKNGKPVKVTAAKKPATKKTTTKKK